MRFHLETLILDPLRDAIRRRKEARQSASEPASDPDLEFHHPGNDEIYAYFKKNARWNLNGYERRTHPDSIEFLWGPFEDLIGTGEVRTGSAYGISVLANRRGLVFAWASRSVWLRLRNGRQTAARQDGAWFDLTYGSDWAEFRIGGRQEISCDWREALRRWAKVSYEDSMEIE
jgi:hypothetical protein